MCSVKYALGILLLLKNVLLFKKIQMPVQKIIHGGQTIGVKILRPAAGSTPVTGMDDPLQALTISHPAGHIIAPHVHSRAPRSTQKMQKALVVISGKIKIDLYSEEKEKIKSLTLTSGQAFVLLAGDWSVRFLEKSQLLEFKNGPFLNDKMLI